MGIGTEQALRIRAILADRRAKLDLSQQAVADRVAQHLGRPSLTKQAISQWEHFVTQPGIDEFAAWARAVDMKLHVEVYDPNDDRVETPVEPGLVETVARLHDLSPDDRELVSSLVRRLTPVPPPPE